MELKEYASVLFRQAGSILICLAVALLLGWAYLAVTPPTYTARSEFFLSADADGVGTLLDQSRYSEQRAKSYAEIVDSPAVLQPVIDDLEMSTTVSELGQSVEASVPLETVLLTVEVTREDPDEAVSIAASLGSSVLSLIEDLEGGGTDGLTVTAITEAELAPFPTSPNRLMILAASMVLGLGAGLAFAIVRHVRDTIVRTPEDIERIVKRTIDRTLLRGMDSSDDQSRRVSFLDSSSVATYLAGGLKRGSLVYVLHDGQDLHLPELLLGAVSGLGEAEKSVCVIDADAQSQLLSTWAHLDAAPGWTDVVTGACTLEEVVVDGPGPFVQIVPSGHPTDVDTAQELSVIQQIERRYSSTVVMARYDGSKAGPQLSGSADVVIIWVERGVSPRRTLSAHMEMAAVSHASRILVVTSSRVRSRRRRRHRS